MNEKRAAVQEKVSVGAEPFYLYFASFSPLPFFFPLFTLKASLCAGDSHRVSMQAEKLAALSRPGRDSGLEGPAAKRRGGLAVGGWEGQGGEDGEGENGRWGGGRRESIPKRTLEFYS